MISSLSRFSSVANLPADCINLGQGYMNFPPPKWVTDEANKALQTVVGNHYSHPKGRIRLREAIRDYYSPLFHTLGRPLDVENEILVSSGANEGRHPKCSIKSLNISPRPILCLDGLPRGRRRSNPVRTVL